MVNQSESVADMIKNFNSLEVFTGITVVVGIRYLVLAFIAWTLCYWLFYSRWFHRKIVKRHPRRKDIRRELLYSALSILIFGAVGMGTITLARMGYTRIYWSVAERGSGWFALSILLAVLLHDTYFYWSHRWMHHPKLFHWVHKVHHQSNNPTPWASYSFSFWEAMAQAAIFPLTAFLIPIHPLAFGIFMGWQIFNNVLGHTGFEFYPRWMMKGWLRYLLNTPTNHIMHHEKPNGNYGIYFNIWDRIMGTNHPDYDQRLTELIQAKRNPTIPNMPQQERTTAKVTASKL
jgi:lathosterol oxidase